MKIIYDPKVDAAYIRLKDGDFQVITQRISEDIAINYAPDGSVVGIEILDAKRYLRKRKYKKLHLELVNLQPISVTGK
ncbi:DUF2283 domain-containing protein [Patescibacteria group bacterium]|nr:DUF2283 domain-containing protein [Patescibacteria group bacterium]MBU4481140.1 DUF2283 domain-containing protein [Patescibacteria group bacterium]